jgi:Sulfotransferase family
VSRGDGGAPIRSFIVGCPRSGTTLLQTMLAAHPDVYSFPESHYFRKVWGRMWPYRRMGVVSPRAADRAVRRLVDETGSPTSDRRVPPMWPLYGAYGRTFTDVVDRACTHAGSSAWVEKSPIHLHCLDLIVRSVPDARFIHVVRDGRDVVASLFDLCVRDPEGWAGQLLPRTRTGTRTVDASPDVLLAAAIDRWNGDLGRTLRVKDDPRHHVVVHSRLVEDPAASLREIARFLGFGFDERMLRYREAAEGAIGWRASLEHMRGPFEPLRADRLNRFESVFTAHQRADVQHRLFDGGDVEPLFERTAGTIDRIGT